MRSGAVADRRGLVHEAAAFGSDEELLALLVPFVEGGVDAGEPVVLAFDDAAATVLRSALGRTGGVSFVPAPDRHARPAATMRAHLDRCTALLGTGAERVRVAGTVPHPGVGAAWGPWARYEAAVNRAFAELPIWALCAYDARTAPPAVLEDLRRTHPLVASPDGHRHSSDHFVAPEAFACGLPGPTRPGRAADLVLHEPTIADGRQAAGDGAVAAGLSFEARDAIRLATSEVVTNALRHGGPPAELAVWHEPGGIVVVVSDAGPGPEDPLVGLLRPRRPSTDGGFGLWITHQLCDEVVLGVVDGRFTVRLGLTERR